MHNNVNFGVWRTRAHLFHRSFLDAFAQAVNLLEGKCAWRGYDHIRENFIACPAHADTSHFGNAIKLVNMSLNLSRQLFGRAVNQSVDSLFRQAQADPEDNARNTESRYSVGLS